MSGFQVPTKQQNTVVQVSARDHNADDAPLQLQDVVVSWYVTSVVLYVCWILSVT